MMVEDNDTISRINRTGASAIERGHEVLGSLARQQERMGVRKLIVCRENLIIEKKEL